MTTISIPDEQAMKALGERLGRLLRGGDVLELIGDVGAGKTTLAKGIARGLSIEETVQSPSFTISREYQASEGLYLVHYDFYRLNEAGIMASDVRENMGATDVVTIIEWAGVVDKILPSDRVVIRIESGTDETTRRVVIEGHGTRGMHVAQELSA